VSDAGTPLLSDPGYRLVRAAHEKGIRVSPVPGPSAIAAALSAAGMPTDRFCFEGFLPARRAARQQRLQALAREPRTQVFFEAVHRIADTVADMTDVFGAERPAFIGRELTKLHEQCVHSTLGALLRGLHDAGIAARGEFVIVVAGAEEADAPSLDVDGLLQELAALVPARKAAAIAARVTGGRRNALYERLLELSGKR